MMRTVGSKALTAAALAMTMALPGQAAEPVVKIGILTDMSGPYSDMGGPGSVAAAAKTTEAKVVAAKMRELPIRDAVMHHPAIRPDGRVIHDMLLVKVKTPAESKGDWDYYTIQATIPAADAFRPLDKSACPLVKG